MKCVILQRKGEEEGFSLFLYLKIRATMTYFTLLKSLVFNIDCLTDLTLITIQCIFEI